MCRFRQDVRIFPLIAGFWLAAVLQHEGFLRYILIPEGEEAMCIGISVFGLSWFWSCIARSCLLLYRMTDDLVSLLFYESGIVGFVARIYYYCERMVLRSQS